MMNFAERAKPSLSQQAFAVSLPPFLGMSYSIA